MTIIKDQLILTGLSVGVITFMNNDIKLTLEMEEEFRLTDGEMSDTNEDIIC